MFEGFLFFFFGEIGRLHESICYFWRNTGNPSNFAYIINSFYLNYYFFFSDQSWMVWNWENPQWLYVIYNFVQSCKSSTRSVDCIGMNQLFKYSGQASSHFEIEFLFLVSLSVCSFLLSLWDALCEFLLSSLCGWTNITVLFNWEIIGNLFIVHKSYHENNIRYCCFFYYFFNLIKSLFEKSDHLLIYYSWLISSQGTRTYPLKSSDGSEKVLFLWWSLTSVMTLLEDGLSKKQHTDCHLCIWICLRDLVELLCENWNHIFNVGKFFYRAPNYNFFILGLKF